MSHPVGYYKSYYISEEVFSVLTEYWVHKFLPSRRSRRHIAEGNNHGKCWELQMLHVDLGANVHEKTAKEMTKNDFYRINKSL
jgi:hypothetical protein